ncbi:hypothetical protein CRENBAI_016074 [Crenichthys baileyi]|uniref:Uncharacterized protein n=1 Tax=Crenichthys baileyi TaxID=28760 RepID=A0AAV9RJM7_9TELE
MITLYLRKRSSKLQDCLLLRRALQNYVTTSSELASTLAAGGGASGALQVTQSCLELIAQRGDVGECAAATDVCKETAGHDPCVPSPSPLHLIITFTTTTILDRIRGWASCTQRHCSSEDSRRTLMSECTAAFRCKRSRHMERRCLCSGPPKDSDCMTNHVPDRSASTSLPRAPASSLSSTTPPDDSSISLKEESFHSFVESRLTTASFLLNYFFVATGSSYCSPNHMASSLSSTSEPHSAAETRVHHYELVSNTEDMSGLQKAAILSFFSARPMVFHCLGETSMDVLREDVVQKAADVALTSLH